jgi:hypothetical protein
MTLLGTKDTASRRVFPESAIRRSLGDLIELSYGLILVLRVFDLVETGRHSPLSPLAKIAPASMLVR